MEWLRGLTAFQRLGVVTILGLLALITLGGSVRVTESGLACPDWPLCYGSLLPSGPFVSEGRVFEGHQVYLEWTHRLVASVIGVVIVAFVAGAWLKYRDRRWVVLPATAAIVALAVQVVLGGLTVTEDLDAGIVASHLGLAMVIVLLIMGAWLATFVPVGEHRPTGRAETQASAPTIRLAKWAVVSAAAVLGLMVLGGYVSGTDAAFFCDADWPLCNGSFFPEGKNANIQMSHRYVAVIVGVLLVGLWVLAYHERRAQRGAFFLSTLLGILFLVQ
ncbi:MAG TPA: COX15/CtaA family protein, partial [Dehalococcoidia bacterium]|nr:COX15/CtaA family protein [Dehalococcoidia bacterium]